ncbi:sugar porter family MFS transporter [Acanthopleuribacter pedis]|uniref:Sugar porter family MFS transporter n=1 Tax=Acanthopleuribacter pedis TaxID=442870 RepID=A0A8J7QEX6_9BACT|nr:sugar porter family MFS transporter [Acanthopleuribacter pedis]MBO1323442.1 sugar porter family MFS transporter [Acanthopleuribacter pedis]
MNATQRVFFTAAIVSLGGFVFGYDASVISGVVGFVTGEFGLNEWQQGFVVSAPTLGALLAATVAGVAADRIGRRKVLQIIAFLYLLSAIGSALAPSYAMLVAARFIGGLAFASLMIAPMYIAEISPAALRGKMVSINQLNIMLGFSASYFANYLLLQASGWQASWVTNLGLDTAVWRWMLGLEILPAGAYFILLHFVPESPRWLVVAGRAREAEAVLLRVMPEDEVAAHVQAVQSSAAEHRPGLGAHLRELFSPKLRFALTIGVIVGVAQQITGINAIYFYAPSIFEQSGVGTDAAFAQAICVGLINVVFTLIAMALIDKLGRKPLLIGGLTGICVSMALCAYGFSSATYLLEADTLPALPIAAGSLDALVGLRFDSDVAFKAALAEALGADVARAHQAALLQAAIDMNPWLVLFGILGFVASFAVSLGPVMWVLFAEIFPNHIRGLAISLVGAINSLVSFAVQFLFPWELAHLGAALTFGIYGVFALIGVLLVAWILPETKGKSLEELEKELTGDTVERDGADTNQAVPA